MLADLHLQWHKAMGSRLSFPVKDHAPTPTVLMPALQPFIVQGYQCMYRMQARLAGEHVRDFPRSVMIGSSVKWKAW